MAYYLKYSLTKLGEELYGLEHIRWGKQLWAMCKVRKDHVCVITGKPIKKGEDAYRPITNGGNRYERISPEFFEVNK
ncbi:unnamed protein product [marine sediment metagenome]|uniref:Uncharacterized protein n=1 Tax=marine sediment metagenome TaxID=412755 RepID=X1QG13_9ZZZZ